MEEDARPWYRRPGWIVSALIHGGVVVLTFLSFTPTYEPPVIEEFVPVSMMEIAETTNVKPATKAKEPKPEPEPAAKPDPKPKTAPTVPEPKPEPEPEPKPEPKPEPNPEPPPPEPEPEPTPPPPEPEPAPPPPEPTAEVEPDPAPPTPRAKPKEVKEPPKDVADAKPKKDPPKDPPKEPKPEEPPAEEEEPFDVDAVIAGLEDKENDDDTTEEAPEEKPAADPESQKGKGDPKRATAAIRDAFLTQIARCWSPPVGAPDAENLVVDIRIKLNRDGSLNGMPQFVDSSRLSDPYYRAAAESGRRAIMQCQNYELPADSYEQWADLIIAFDPSQMLGL
jgi:hypothetical protein